jgi:hydroxyacyl-ACP dehydratase HTD2-like protein with hotdog domain
MKNNIPEMTHLMEQNQQKHCNMLTIHYLMVYGDATFNMLTIHYLMVYGA